MKHDTSSDDSGSNGSSKSEEWVLSVSDNIPVNSEDVVRGAEEEGRGNNETGGEGHLLFEIEGSAKKSMDEKVHLAMIARIKDFFTENPKFHETVDGINILYRVCRDGLLQVLKCFVEEFHIDVNMSITTNGMKETPLHVACHHKQLPIIQYLLEHGSRIDAKQTNGYTPFHIACEKGFYDIVVALTNFLKNHNLDVIEMKQNDDWTGLHLAARNGHANIVAYLIENGLADANAADGNHKTSLHFASCCGHYDIVQLLVKHQEKHPKKENYITEAVQKNGWNALHCATRYGHAAIVQYLIADGKMDVNSTWNGEEGETSLHIACQYGYVDIVRHLLQHEKIEYYIDALPHRNTPSHIACIHGHLQILEELYQKDPITIKMLTSDETTVAHLACMHGYFDIVKWMFPLLGNDCGGKNKNGLTPLHSACINDHIDIAKYLVKNMPMTLLGVMCSSGKTALHYAIQHNHFPLVETFFNNGKMSIDDLHTTTGTSYLQYACLYGHMEIATYLIQHQHAKVDHPKKDSWTALHVASRNNQLDVVQLLVEVGQAEVDKETSNGWTALQLASRFGHLEVVQYLLQSGDATVDMCDKEGRTALHFATVNGYIDVVKFLLQDGGANIEIETTEGNTALHIASSKMFLGMVKLLLQCGANVNATNQKNETPLRYSHRILNPPAAPQSTHSYHSTTATSPEISISDVADLLTPFRKDQLIRELDVAARNDIRRLVE